MLDENTDLELMQYEDNLDKQFNHLLDELVRIRVGRANPKLVENIRVDYYGTMTPLIQTSNITVQDARMLVVTPYDASTLKGIRAGLEAANLGVSLNDDGRLIRIGFPALTEERRREYTKDAKKLLEECKIGMRNYRRDCLDVFKTMKKNSAISEDEYNTLDEDVQKRLDAYIEKADKACEKKIVDIMEV